MALTLNDYAMDFGLQAQRVLDIADEVQKAVSEDNLDGAILVLGVSHGKLAELEDSMATLQKKLSEAGANWKRALGREGDD